VDESPPVQFGAQQPRPAQPIVKYEGRDFPIIQDLTEREKFDAERLSGQSIDELGNYTSMLLLAYFTLKRSGFTFTFDEFIDDGAFEVAEAPPPLDEPPGNELATLNESDPTENGGHPTGQPSLEFTPGT